METALLDFATLVCSEIYKASFKFLVVFGSVSRLFIGQQPQSLTLHFFSLFSIPYCFLTNSTSSVGFGSAPGLFQGCNCSVYPLSFSVCSIQGCNHSVHPFVLIILKAWLDIVFLTICCYMITVS